MNLTPCRHNPNHKVKISRLLIHENSCPERLTNPLATCPYNAIHKFPHSKLEHHKSACPNKPQVDKDVERELREFLAKQSSSKGNNSNNIKTNISEINGNSINSINNQNRTNNENKNSIISKQSIVGMGIKESDLHKKRKLEQKRMKQLMEDFSYCDVHDEVGIDFSSKDENDLFESCEIYRSPDISFKIEDDYDPNKEDENISSKNKNYISFNVNNNLSSIKKSYELNYGNNLKVSAYDAN